MICMSVLIIRTIHHYGYTSYNIRSVCQYWLYLLPTITVIHHIIYDLYVSLYYIYHPPLLLYIIWYMISMSVLTISTTHHYCHTSYNIWSVCQYWLYLPTTITAVHHMVYDLYVSIDYIYQPPYCYTSYDIGPVCQCWLYLPPTMTVIHQQYIYIFPTRLCYSFILIATPVCIFLLIYL